MYNLLIVEDEELIRNKILHCTDWHAQGFGEVFSAENGVAAMGILKEHVIDILITDIQMPQMGGIELIREIRLIDKKMGIIVISGYAEFEYAKEFIRMNVKDYVLKPFRSKNFLDIVKKAKDDLIRQRSESEEIENMKKELKENHKLLEEKFFTDLLNNCFIGEIRKSLDYLNLTRIEQAPYTVSVLNIEGFEELLDDVEEENKYIRNLRFFKQAEQYLQSGVRASVFPNNLEVKYYLINYRLDQLILISFLPCEMLISILEDFIGWENSEIGHQITVGLSNVFFDLKQLHIALREANSAAKLSVLHGKGILFSYHDICEVDNQQFSKHIFGIVESKIYDNIRTGATKEIREEISTLLLDIKESKLSAKGIESVLSNMIFLCCRTVSEIGFSFEEIFGRKGLPTIDWDEITSRAQLEEWLVVFFTTISEHIRTRHNNRNKMLIMEVKEYINQHYSENINLSFFAKKYNISVGYLSVLVNDYVGQNFVEYLTSLRIQKAKELLKNTDMRIYEIAEKIGYHDAYYFSSAFKKTVGLTPTEFRENSQDRSM